MTKPLYYLLLYPFEMIHVEEKNSLPTFRFFLLVYELLKPNAITLFSTKKKM